MTGESIERWFTALLARHTAPFTSAEFLKAIRALSARYVEQRASLHGSSPFDSAGKRAAFAAFYAPLHLVTTRAIVDELGLAAISLERVVDLGCGTGAAGAAWASSMRAPAAIVGVDHQAWALDEARATWKSLGLRGTTRRGDLVDEARAIVTRPHLLEGTGFVLGWSVNELAPASRDRLLSLLISASARRSRILVIEPIARSAAPWWDDWRRRTAEHGWRADEWTLPASLPAELARLDEAAGFRRHALTARTLACGS
jgi:hypothetical protein